MSVLRARALWTDWRPSLPQLFRQARGRIAHSAPIGTGSHRDFQSRTDERRMFHVEHASSPLLSDPRTGPQDTVSARSHVGLQPSAVADPKSLRTSGYREDMSTAEPRNPRPRNLDFALTPPRDRPTILRVQPPTNRNSSDDQHSPRHRCRQPKGRRREDNNRNQPRDCPSSRWTPRAPYRSGSARPT
jgi:hypothetical protein